MRVFQCLISFRKHPVLKVLNCNGPVHASLWCFDIYYDVHISIVSGMNSKEMHQLHSFFVVELNTMLFVDLFVRIALDRAKDVPHFRP